MEAPPAARRPALAPGFLTPFHGAAAGAGENALPDHFELE